MKKILAACILLFIILSCAPTRKCIYCDTDYQTNDSPLMHIVADKYICGNCRTIQRDYVEAR
jgi:hypothetical protein